MGFFDFLGGDSSKTTSKKRSFGVDTYAEGEVFPIKHATKNECSMLEFISAGPSLITYYRNPSPQEIENWRNGEINIHMACLEVAEPYANAIFVVAKIGTDLLEGVFSLGRCRDGGAYALANLDKCKFFNLFLVDADTQVLKGMRITGPGESFETQLRDSILRQKNSMNRFDRDTNEAFIRYVDRKYSLDELYDMLNVRSRIPAN